MLIGSLVVFSLIGVVGVRKKFFTPPPSQAVETALKVLPTPQKNAVETPKAVSYAKQNVKDSDTPKTQLLSLETTKKNGVSAFVDIDRIHQLFTTGPTQLPIVETIGYSSKVEWLKGRPAWIADYASHFGTSRHFIARSLNGKPDYFTQKVLAGSRFNVFKKDKNIDFHLLIDISKCKMAFYYFDHDTNERVLLKTYKVGLGRIDSRKPSGILTPLGDYSIGKKVAIYKPGTVGYFQDHKIEMISVFGTRWIPFEQLETSTFGPAKGYGIHGAPWIEDKETGKLVENRAVVGGYESDGCVRLLSEDMEELFSILITKPTFVHIVKDFHEAKLPGIEVATPKR